MSILAKIGDLIAEHDEQEVKFTKCPGCSTCEEITRLRKIIDPESEKNVRKSTKPKRKMKKKKYHLSKDEIYDYIMQGLRSKQIAERLNVPVESVSQFICKNFPNYKEMKLEAGRRNLERFSKDVFTYGIYKQMKQLNIQDKQIYNHFNISRRKFEYWVGKWKNGQENPFDGTPKPSPIERIDSLIQENADLEVKVYEKEITIQLLQDRIAELEHKNKRSERRSAI